MREHVIVDAGDPFERGRQRGRQCADDVRRTWPTYVSLFELTASEYGREPVDLAAAAESCLDAVSVWSPPLLRELEGVAAGAEFPLASLAVLNARTEVFATAAADHAVLATECSTMVQVASWVSGQTWDWHEELADGWHPQTVKGDAHDFVGLTEYGLLAKIGVNSAGLGLHFNLLRHDSDGLDVEGGYGGPARAAVPVHLVARAILGGAATVAEAIDIARSAPLAASTVVTAVTADESACIELSPAGVGVVEPAEGWLIHANHFLDPSLAQGEAVTRGVTTTFERGEVMRERAAGFDDRVTADGMTDLLCCHDEGAALCRHPEPGAAYGFRTATLATVVLEPRHRRAHIFDGGPCERSDSAVLAAE